jgi:hypothetical protein
MRTTLTIDDDLFAAAKSMARARSEPLGRVVSDLARRGLSATPRVRKKGRKGFPVFRVPTGAYPITLVDVGMLENEA